MSDINLELYRVFYTVAKNKSITQTAEELNVSQPAISHSIKQLEKKLNGRLFLRQSKGMKLTEQGELIFDHVKRALALIENAENRFTHYNKMIKGRIKIAASDMVTKHYLINEIKKFNSKYSEATLIIKNDTSNSIIKLIKDGKVDLGFVTGPIEDNTLKITEYRNIRNILVCSPEFVLPQKNPLTLEEILLLPLIAIEKGSNSRDAIDRFFAERDMEFKTLMDLGSTDLALELAIANLGVAYVPEIMAEKYINSNKLIEIKTKTELPKQRIQIIELKNTSLNFLTSEFKKTVKEKE